MVEVADRNISFGLAVAAFSLFFRFRRLYADRQHPLNGYGVNYRGSDMGFNPPPIPFQGRLLQTSSYPHAAILRQAARNIRVHQVFSNKISPKNHRKLNF